MRRKRKKTSSTRSCSLLKLLPCTHTHSYEDATAVVTMGEGKYYSLGLDLSALQLMSGMEMMYFADDLQKLLLRLLTFPLVTVAAINGRIGWQKKK